MVMLKRRPKEASTNSPLVSVDYAKFASSRSERDKASFRKAVMQLCLDGKIVVLKDADLGLDMSVFRTDRPFPGEMCKLGAMNDQTPVEFEYHDKLPFRLVYPGCDMTNNPYVTERDMRRICEGSFGGDWSRFDRFIEGSRKAEVKLREVSSAILADYDYYSDAAVWRFSQPDSSKIHYDPNPGLEAKESLRFFINLDEKPRHWRCALTLLEFVEREYDSMKLGHFFTMTSKDRMATMIKTIMASPAFQNSPRIPVRFEPGDVWVFDGRVIAHDVVDGRSALSLTTKMRRDALPAYHVGLKERLFDIHERKVEARLSGKRAAARKEEALTALRRASRSMAEIDYLRSPVL